MSSLLFPVNRGWKTPTENEFGEKAAVEGVFLPSATRGCIKLIPQTNKWCNGEIYALLEVLADSMFQFYKRKD